MSSVSSADSSTPTPMDYQENFNVSGQYSDYYNTTGFADGLARSNNAFTETDSDGQKAIEESYNDGEDPVPVMIHGSSSGG